MIKWESRIDLLLCYIFLGGGGFLNTKQFCLECLKIHHVDRLDWFRCPLITVIGKGKECKRAFVSKRVRSERDGNVRYIGKRKSIDTLGKTWASSNTYPNARNQKHAMKKHAPSPCSFKLKSHRAIQ